MASDELSPGLENLAKIVAAYYALLLPAARDLIVSAVDEHHRLTSRHVYSPRAVTHGSGCRRCGLPVGASVHVPSDPL